jgi:hypothetical protein
VKSEILANVVILALGCFFLYLTEHIKGFAHEALGGAFWPRMVLLLLVGLTMFHIIGCLRKRDNARDTETPSGKQSLEMANIRARVVPALLSLVAYGILMKHLGFIISSLIFQAVFLYILERQVSWRNLVVPFVLTSVLFILFVRVMALPLPRGTGIFREFSHLFY